MLLPELLATLGLVNPGRHWPSPTAAPARNYKDHWSSQLPATAGKKERKGERKGKGGDLKKRSLE